MEVKTTYATCTSITGIKGLDEIRVYLEDFGPGQGSVIINCYDKVWRAYFGAMGCDNKIKDFICGASVDYLCLKLINEYDTSDLKYLERIVTIIKDVFKPSLVK